MNFAARSLILDLDGTLIDSRPGVLESFGAAAREALPGRAFDAAKVALGPPIRRMFELAFPNITGADADALVAAFRLHYDREGALRTRLFAGAVEALAACAQRGAAMRIATNKPHRISTVILERLQVGHFFRTVIASDSVRPPFPSKGEMVRHLMKADGVNAAETLFVGDSMEDAAAAAENGLRFVFAAYGYGALTEERARETFRVIQGLGELPALLG